MAPPHERFDRVTLGFSAVVDQVTDWSVPTPVPGWQARDIVHHLVTWLPGFLAGAGLTLPEPTQAREHPAAGWATLRASVADLLDSPRAAAPFDHPHAAAPSVAEAIDRFWTTDVLLHTWDLARATHQPHGLDEVETAELLAGMRAIEPLLRGSGQYGPAVPVPTEASSVDQLMGFIGRDPAWTATSGG